MTHIVLSRIFYMSFQGSNTNFHLTSHILGVQTFIKKLSLGQYGLTHIFLSKTLCKFPAKLVLKCLLKNRIWVWPIFSFEGSYSYANFHQKLIYFFYSKKLYQGHYGLANIVFSRILYKCSPNAHIFFGVKKFIEKLYQGQHGLTLLFLFKDSIKFSLKVHAILLFQMSF